MESLLSYLTALLLAVGTWWGGSETVPVRPATAEVVQVIDGDTIDVVLDGEEERIRYIGIDTPEIDYETGDKECYAEEAKEKNVELVAGKRVELVKDVRERDDYGRLLRYVYVEEESVGEALVQGGFARAVYFKPDITHYDRLRSVEGEARASGAGLWSACQ